MRLEALAETNLMPDEAEHSSLLRSADEGDTQGYQVIQSLTSELAGVGKKAQEVTVRGQHRQMAKEDEKQSRSEV